MLTKKFRLLCTTIAGYAVLNSIQIPTPPQLPEAFRFDQAALAGRSGGRSSSGSFSRSSSRSRSSSPSRSQGSDTGGGTAIAPGGGSTVIVTGGGSSGYSSGGSVAGVTLIVVVLLMIGGVAFAVWYLTKSKKSSAQQELENDIVTVTKVQVGLLAEGRAIQAQLTEIAQNAEGEDSRHQQLQESVLALLRMPENWSHVRASSETLKSRQEAQQQFQQMSIAERSKYSTETLANVGGKITHKAYTIDPDKDPASYIVVTLLVGTADDRPLVEEVRTSEALKETLEKLASIDPDYLMVFELQWTPQAEGDSLTYDEMLLEYPDLLQI